MAPTVGAAGAGYVRRCLGVEAGQPAKVIASRHHEQAVPVPISSQLAFSVQFEAEGNGNDCERAHTYSHRHIEERMFGNVRDSHRHTMRVVAKPSSRQGVAGAVVRRAKAL
jgi:hypothetical protein